MLAAGVLFAFGFVLVGRYVLVRARAADLSGAWRGTDGSVAFMLSLVGSRYRFAGHCWLARPRGRTEGTVRGRCDHLGRLQLTVQVGGEPALRFRGRVTAAGRLVGSVAAPGGNPFPLRFRAVAKEELARVTRGWPAPVGASETSR